MRILVDHWGPDQGRLDLRFHLGQLLMAGSNKCRNAPCREMDTQQVLQELACASIGQRLSLHQIDCQGLDPFSLLRRGVDQGGKCSSRPMEAYGTAFFFNPMLGNAEAKRWKIGDLATFWIQGRLLTHVVLAGLTAFDRINAYFIGHLDLLEGMPSMPFLSTGLLAARWPQTLGWTNKAIQGRG